MPIINPVDRRTIKGRLLIAGLYALLSLGGVCMATPFLIMLCGAMATSFDYERREALPRWIASREDRFMRVLATYFPAGFRGSIRQMRCAFPDLPEDWQIWAQIGEDRQASDAWARAQLDRLKSPRERESLANRAKDYRDFVAGWDISECVLPYDQRYVAPFLRDRYQTLNRFNAAWEVSLDDFSQVLAFEWAGEPIDQRNYVPLRDVRYQDLLSFRQAYRENRFTPHLSGEKAPASILRPASLRFLWEDYVARNAASIADEIGLDALPFPAPDSSSPEMTALWQRFLDSDFPARHFAIEVDEGKKAAFRTFLMDRFKTLKDMNRVLETSVASWDEIPLTPTVPEMPLATVWMDFVTTLVPVSERTLRDTLPDQAFQRFALARHGSLERINEVYGLTLQSLEQLKPPLGEAILVTFQSRERAFTLDLMTSGFRTVLDTLMHRGRAIPNTIILVSLAILVALTVNPLAGYALSRFRLRSSEKVIVFCLATMAFPSAVAAIPGFLLLRDLGLLNTFAALVLPGAANGMSIFLMKGFFDSLPQELYEAAAIDGAPEVQVFFRISLPLVKPILAVSMLNAFIGAYNGWEWAIIVCQDRKMWTVAVWTYQFYQTLGSQPSLVMAAFVVNSIPVFVIFLLCQKIILRGIVLPQMK